MKKEPLVFLITIAALGGLYFLGAPEEEESTRSGTGRSSRGKTGDASQTPIEAKRVPGRFIGGNDVSWAGDASNIFETPTETRDLPALEIVAPIFPRLVHPGPALPMPLSQKARTSLRRVIVPSAQPASAEPANGGGSGGATAAAQPAPASATQPTQPDSLIPLGKQLSAVDRARLTLEQEQARIKAEIAARQSDEDRKKALDKLTMANGTLVYGEMVAPRNENRFQIKRDLDKLRTDPALTEPERNDRLKKFQPILFREDKKGKLGKAVSYPADSVQTVAFADTPENRYRAAVLEKDPKDLAQQLELARIVFDARLFKLAADHLLAMKKAGLTSAESLAMLADSQHELFDYNPELDVLQQAVKAFPDSTALLGRLGRLQALLGMREDARATFELALAKNSNDPLANAGMAAILLRSGEAGRAIPHLKEALNLAGSDPLKVDAIRLLLAEAYLGLGDFKNAHETVDLILQRSNVTAPERQRVFERAFALATVAAIGGGQLAEARTRAEEGAKRYPLSGQLSFLLATVMMQQGELAAARSRLATAMELDPLLTGHVQVALAIVEESSARDNEAAAAAEAGALNANPAAPELRLPLGRALLHVGDLGRAREQLLAALDAEPASADVLAALGDVAYAENNLPDAIRYYDRAAAIEPNFPQLSSRRIVTHVRRRKLADAEELVAKTGNADLKDPFFQAALAYFQYSKGNHAEALQLLQRLGEIDAGNLADYAKDVHKNVTAHQNKAMWTDTFSRTAGSALGREWKREVGSGVNLAITKTQAVAFDGTQKGTSDQPTMIWQERPGDRLYGFSVDLDLPVQAGVYAGAGIMVFNQTGKPEKWPGYPERQGGLAPYTGLQVALSPEGRLVHRILEKGKMSEWLPLEKSSFVGGPVTIELRMADVREGVVEVLVNRESVLKRPFADLKRFKRTLELQVFCQGQIDRKVHFTADNVTIVTVKDPR